MPESCCGGGPELSTPVSGRMQGFACRRAPFFILSPWRATGGCGVTSPRVGAADDEGVERVPYLPSGFGAGCRRGIEAGGTR